MSILAIIPARAGSKRIPKKNIRPLNGKPLIQWTIEAALSVSTIDKVLVSSDSESIVNLSRGIGAEAPFLRPSSLSCDKATTIDVVEHALSFYELQSRKFDTVVLLQPTSPLRNADHISRALNLFFEKHAHSVISVSECEHTPLWSNTLPNDVSMTDFLTDSVVNMRSQDLPTYYRLNGAIYISKVDVIKRERRFISNTRSFAFIMEKESSIDIDTEIDFLVATHLMEARRF